MSRTAAAILGLTLVALSIGFNTLRYPAVWDMSGPAMASESPAVAASPSKKTEDPAPALPPPSAASPSLATHAESSPNAADRFAADRSAPAAPPSPGNADSTAHAGSFDAPEPRRPLVPVSALGGTELAAGVRRLPPVDRANPNGMNPGVGSTLGGPVPWYPRTGI